MFTIYDKKTEYQKKKIIIITTLTDYSIKDTRCKHYKNTKTAQDEQIGLCNSGKALTSITYFRDSVRKCLKYY